MDELVSQTRQNLRVLNSVPGLSFVANLPVVSLRRLPPIPGLDVAVGVTAHQLSLHDQGDRGGTQLRTDAGRRVGGARQTGGGEAADAAEQIGRQGAEVATGATEGAMWAAADVTMEVGRVAEEAMQGTMQASPGPRPIRSTRCAAPCTASSRGRARPACTWATPSDTR